MNLMTSLSHSLLARWKRPRARHQAQAALWMLTALILALLGTAAALVRNLDDEPKIAFGTRVLGYIGSLLKPEAPASGTAAASVIPLQPRH